MRVFFIVKASTEIGFGHLIRSRTLADSFESLKHPDDHIAFYIIGDTDTLKLMHNKSYEIQVYSSESELFENISKGKYDVAIFDTLEVGHLLFVSVKSAVTKVVSLSPIFNQNENVDIIFHRSKYFEKTMPSGVKMHKGLQYSLIQKHCVPIAAGDYKRNVESPDLSIAISMGGGDAANKTLKILKILNNIDSKLVIWCMLGQGYKHSYDELIQVSDNSRHEIILAKTNQSMWRILGMASLIILPGGITSYEAAFVGLPSVNIQDSDKNNYLVQELLDKGVAIAINNAFSKKFEIDFLNVLKKMKNNRNELYLMHLNAKGLIDNRGGERIFEILKAETA